MKRKYILNRKDFINENSDNLEKSEDGLVKFGMGSTIQKLRSKLSNTNDLWIVDKLTNELEGKGPKTREEDVVTGEEYNNFHRVLIPNWIQKYWMKGMEFDGQDLKELLYDDLIPKFQEHLKELGYESQEVFVAYTVGAIDDDDYSDRGMFKIGFDVFKNTENEEENQSGWMLFSFHIGHHGIHFEEPKKYTDSFYTGSSVGNVNILMKMGEGTFHSFKHSGPGTDMADSVSDGGYILRND